MLFKMIKIGLALSFSGFWAWSAGGQEASLLKLEKRSGDQPLESLYYSVQKDGKEHWFLGAIYVGLSVEELDCRTQIEEQVSKSDLVFLETVYDLPFSWEELEAVYTGPSEEREAVLARLSLEERRGIETREEVLESVYYPQFEYYGEDSFEDLSPETQEFLLSIGQAPSNDFGSHFLHIFTSAYYKAYYSYPPGLDFQIGKLALSKNLPILALDSDDQILSDMSAEARAFERFSLEDIEEAVADYHNIAQQNWQIISQVLARYRAGNFEKLSEYGADLPEAAVRKRQENWLKRFKTAHQSPQNESIFTAVGLIHLIYSSNILDMLREEGFFVQRVKCPLPEGAEAL